jgi:hypothetical protein
MENVELHSNELTQKTVEEKYHIPKDLLVTHTHTHCRSLKERREEGKRKYLRKYYEYSDN